jgi:hypothetical protein
MSLETSLARLLMILAFPVTVSCGTISTSTPSTLIVDMEPQQFPTEDPNKNLEFFKIIGYTPANLEAEKETATLGAGPVLNYFFITDPKVAGSNKSDAISYEVFLVKTNVKNSVKNLETCFKLIMNERPHLNKADLFTIMRTNLDKNGEITSKFWSLEFE